MRASRGFTGGTCSHLLGGGEGESFFGGEDRPHRPHRAYSRRGENTSFSRRCADFAMRGVVSPHSYRDLIKRWRNVAERAGVKLRPLNQADGERLYYMETPAAREAEPVYVSAGIHGDEAGSTEALLAWAELEVKRIARWPLLIFPCLNPWGLRNNIRTDASGLDLNRSFHTDHPTVAALKRVVGKRRLQMCLHLHEDYDGEGMYVYELSRDGHWAESLLSAAESWIPPDPRGSIDISRAKGGVVRRRLTRNTFEKLGYPEAVWLFFEHTDHAFTIETPSEFALERRVAAHVAALGEMARRAFGNTQRPTPHTKHPGRRRGGGG